MFYVYKNLNNLFFTFKNNCKHVLNTTKYVLCWQNNYKNGFVYFISVKINNNIISIFSSVKIIKK